ncbi:hemerythrin domain-containing protein [Longivirga aurantiaca]|uniref:Hemerythrin domain-containing protein n=1 Tax=Longivirga aurantiaca TaxID=1837743 RepID=A0ABW1SYY0_9ACTN
MTQLDKARPDTRDMLVVHTALRREIGALPALVRGVADDDTDRSAVVGGHYALMARLLHIHHEGEDVALWPVLHQRAPEAAELVARMQREHADLGTALETADSAVPRWQADPTAAAREEAAAAIAAVDRVLIAHLAEEESEVLPLAERVLTVDEWDAIGAHARSHLTPDTAFVIFGMLLEEAPAPVAEAMLGTMPPPAREAFHAVGQKQYDDYIAGVRA